MREDGSRRPVKLVCATLGVARSSFYRSKESGEKKGKRGPKTEFSDEEVLGAIKEVLGETPFWGEGHRKVWARLRKWKNIFVSQKRVLRIMRENGLLAPFRKRHVHSDGKHDGTIIPKSVNELWGADAARLWTEEDGCCWAFVCIDHYNLEPFVRVSKSGTKFEALDPVLKAVKERFGRVEKGVCRGLTLRHDHGSQYISKYFQSELRWLGIRSSPAYVGEPEGNGVAEWFIRILKEQVIWPNRFKNVAQAADAIEAFVQEFKRSWIIARLGYRTPLEVLQELSCNQEVAD